MRYLPIMILLAGCAPAVINGNEAGGLVRVRGSFNQQSKGMSIATTECRKYGRIARYVSMNDVHGTLNYECVKP